MANSVNPDQTAPIGAVCSGSMLFASILNSPVMLGNYLLQTTSADDIFRCIFSWRFKSEKQKNIVLKKLMHFGYMKFYGLRGNPLCDFKEWGCTYKNTHISAATHPRILNLVPQ